MTDSTAVAAPPTAQEALEMLDQIAECKLYAGDLAAHIMVNTIRAFIEHAAAEADAWAKIEAWCKDNPCCCYSTFFFEGAWGAQMLDEDNDCVAHLPGAPTRPAALQLAAAWCEKEGA